MEGESKGDVRKNEGMELSKMKKWTVWDACLTLSDVGITDKSLHQSSIVCMAGVWARLGWPVARLLRTCPPATWLNNARRAACRQ